VRLHCLDEVTSGPRVVAACVFYDAWDILPYTLEHLVSLGITDLWLVDHSSPEDRSEELRRAMAGRADLRVVRKSSLPLLHGRIQSLLAEVARQEEFDVFVPFDHDEYLDVAVDGTDVLAEIAAWYEDSAEAEILVPIKEYLQRSSVRDFGPDTLDSCRFSVPRGRSPSATEEVGFAVGQTALGGSALHKALVNLRAIPSGQRLTIAQGSHRVRVADANPTEHPHLSETLVIRHLPYRSRAAIRGRVEASRRHRMASLPRSVSWHLRDFDEADDALLDRVWSAHSWTEQGGSALGVHVPGSPTAALSYDPRLAAILGALRDVVTERYGGRCEGADLPAGSDERLAERLLAAAVDSDVGLPPHHATDAGTPSTHEANRRHAEAGDGGATDGEARASLELQRLLQTRSWRWTRPLRRIVPSPPTERERAFDAAPESPDATWGFASRSLRREARRLVRRLVLGVWTAYRTTVPLRLRRSVPRSVRVPTERVLKRLARAQSRLSVVARPDSTPSDDPAYDRYHRSIVGPAPAWKPARVVAFYLPQYHRIPENDKWWGDGFTDWVNVDRARPIFRGQRQPRVPLDVPLGRYDLRDPDVMRRQMDLARRVGIDAFCFYFYWFEGRTLLEDPLLQLLEDPEADLSFCLMWANERWARTWDGNGDDVLIDGARTPDDYRAMLHHLARYFADPRYLRIYDRPLLGVYRLDELPTRRALRGITDEVARELGLPGIHLVGALSHGVRGDEGIGLDGMVQFPPHNIVNEADVLPEDLRWPHRDPASVGRVWDYDELRSFYLEQAQEPRRVWPTVTLDWDNTPRRGRDASVTIGFGLDRYRDWLAGAIEAVNRNSQLAPFERLVFINAWNEWAEGTYLEPDTSYGFGALQATRDAIAVAGGDRTALMLLVHDLHRHGAQRIALALADTLRRRFRLHVEVLALSGAGELRAAFEASGPLHLLDELDDASVDAVLSDLRQRGADRAIINSIASARVLPRLADHGIRTVALVHELPDLLQRMDLLGAADDVRRLADAVVFPSEHVRARFEQRFGGIAGLIDIRPQGLYRAAELRTVGADDVESFRRDAMIPPATKIVLGIGYGDRRKGVDIFTEVVNRIDGDDVLGLWVGDLAPEMLEALGITDTPSRVGRVRFCGRMDNVAAAIRASDVLFVASREDPFPTTALEALQAGLPVVVRSGCTGLEDIVEATGVGVVIDGDVDEMAEKLGAVLDDADLRRRTAEAGPALVRGRFDFGQYVDVVIRHAGIDVPRVSVVVPSFQHAKFLAERLDSITAQTHPLHEVVIIDDGSTDGSLDIISGWAERVDISVQVIGPDEERRGPVGSWTRGVDAATGDFVWIAESDDVSDPRFVETLLARILEGGTAHGFTDSSAIDETSKVLVPSYALSGHIQPEGSVSWRMDGRLEGRQDVLRRLLPTNPVMNVSACLFERRELHSALLAVARDRDRYGAATDWVVYAHLVATGSMTYVAQPLNLHRRNPNGLVAQEISLGIHPALVEAARREVLRIGGGDQRTLDRGRISSTGRRPSRGAQRREPRG